MVTVHTKTTHVETLQPHEANAIMDAGYILVCTLHEINDGTVTRLVWKPKGCSEYRICIVDHEWGIPMDKALQAIKENGYRESTMGAPLKEFANKMAEGGSFRNLKIMAMDTYRNPIDILSLIPGNTKGGFDDLCL